MGRNNTENMVAGQRFYWSKEGEMAFSGALHSLLSPGRMQVESLPVMFLCTLNSRSPDIKLLWRTDFGRNSDCCVLLIMFVLNPYDGICHTSDLQN